MNSFHVDYVNLLENLDGIQNFFKEQEAAVNQELIPLINPPSKEETSSISIRNLINQFILLIFFFNLKGIVRIRLSSNKNDI